jgi:tRNA pseudouridine55 synthase
MNGAMDGLILVHKPKGVTSHDIVLRIRKSLRIKKVGHFGTLDPMATGLLLIALGKATRLFPFYLRLVKTYEGEIRLGYATDTYDAEGKPVSENSEDYPDRSELLDTMTRFVGDIEQVPPPYSAKKYKGEPLYRRVRNHKEYALKPTKVRVFHFLLKLYSPPYMEFELRCSSGTYVRSIAHDLGQVLGCGAHLNRLNRTQIGEFHIGQSHPVEEIADMASLGQTGKFLLPFDTLLPEFPKIVVSDSIAPRVLCGNSFIPAPLPKGVSAGKNKENDTKDKDIIIKVFDSRGKFLALAKKDAEKEGFQPFVVFGSSNHPD